MKKQLPTLLRRKALSVLAVTLSILLLVVAPAAVSAQAPSKAADQNAWVLSWSDEFSGAANTSPDSSKWTVRDIGNPSNSELEYYTTRTSNVALDGSGHLVITGRKENYGGRQYTSGRLDSQGKFDTTYGRFETSMKMSYGQGIWPAFWMLGSTGGNWPNNGEIDIMENIGKASEQNKVYGTIHGPGYSGAGGLQSSYTGPRFADGYHTFAVEWEPNVIRWYVDGILYGTKTPSSLPAGTTWVYNHNFFILLNLAIGGSWPGNPDGSTVFPQTLSFDYVRVYKRGTGPTATAVSGGGISTSAWYSVINKNSGKCVDARAAGTTNGTAIQQYACNSTNAQQYQFQTTSGGYYRVNNRAAPAESWDVTGASTADNALIQLWAYGGGNNQQWQAVSEGGGYYHFVNRNSGKCLDVPAASTADSVQLGQFTCNGTAAQSFSLQAH